MKRKMFLAFALVAALAVMIVPCEAFAEDYGPPPPVVAFSPAQLDQMLAPIALYPDSLLAQVLIAATYPDQVMQANDWLSANPGLTRLALNDALNRMDWDLSIKALCPFPQVIAMMARQPDWTRRLGEAFLSQQAAVMDSIQRLRRRAEIAGNLRTTPQQRVIEEDDYIQIVPVDPEVVYVPCYNPVVVYGTWWWPAFPPFVYHPVWPGVVVAPVVGAFGFWGAVTVGPVWSWGWGSWGWGRRNVFINVNRNININTTNVTVINNIRRNIHVTSVRTFAVAGRLGSPYMRYRALGTRIGRPAVLAGHIYRARVFHGRIAPLAGRRFGGSAVGSRGFGRRGFAGRGFGRRPSAASAMNGLRGRRTGTGRWGRSAAGHRSRSFGARANAFGSRRAQRGSGHRNVYRGRKAFGGGFHSNHTSGFNRSALQRRAARPRAGGFRHAPRGGYAARRTGGGFHPAGVRAGGFRAGGGFHPPSGARRGGGRKNGRRRP